MLRRNSPTASRKFKSNRGNTLALVAALTAGIVVAFLIFALGYTRMLGTSAEQKTAVEAAALAAAKDVSRIVVTDPNFGFVSLSDAAPVGKSTNAGDNFFLPVYSINTLMGTIRLELITADMLNNSTMRELARRDLANLKTAKNNLVTAIEASLLPGGHALDLDGKQVSPYQSAENAYKQNQIRMAGQTSYVSGSLKLSLGNLQGGSQTNIPIPKPATHSHVSSSDHVNGYYVSGRNIAYGGEDFVFASAGANLKLVDYTLFRQTLSGLPYDVPSIVRAEADQKQTTSDGHTTHVTHAIACAQPANVYDPRPAPGSVIVAFPDGVPPELVRPGDLLSNPMLSNGQPMVPYTANGGDYPGAGTLAPDPWTGPGSGDVSTIWSTALYDWLRRAGTRTSIAAIGNMQTTPFSQNGASANGWLVSNAYRIDPNGNIVYDTKVLATGNQQVKKIDPYLPVGNKQLYAVKEDALTSTDKFVYDAHIRDYSYRLGPANGGIHGGEPLTNSVVQNATTSSMMIASTEPAPVNIAFDGKSGSGYGCDSVSTGDGAHWMVKTGGSAAGTLLGGLFTSTIDGHMTTFFIYSDAPASRNDFGISSEALPVYFSFASGVAPGQTRPTYLQNGLSAEIRFRRCIPLDKFGMTGKKGYGPTGLRIYPPPAVSPVINM